MRNLDIESVDEDAAYRARVGDMSRGILFLCRYFPLTMTYSFFAVLFFLGTGVKLTLVLLGIAGDLLRWRLAPDLRLANKNWVDLFCDCKANDALKQAYAHWYSGLEKPLILSGILYLILIYFLELAVPANTLSAYLNLFEPLHSWTREHLYIAHEHSADLIAHGYPHRVAFLMHLEMAVIFVCISSMYFASIGGNGWLVKIYINAMTGKNANYYKENQINAVRNSVDIKIISLSILFLSTCIWVFYLKKISWDQCLAGDICPQRDFTRVLLSFIIIGFGGVWGFCTLLFEANVLKAWITRFAQIELMEPRK